jgi:4-amino-4-deoxy-L-arabinose transferase-like glycosyltransferase
MTAWLQRREFFALTAALLFAYLPQLGALTGATRPEEQFNMSVSAEMHRAGAWATPTLDGQPWFYKPPLLYWLERVTYGLSAPSAFTARLPAALAAIALALLTGLLARRLRAGPVLATLLCGGSLGLFVNGRMAITDSLLALSLAAAFTCLWEAHLREDGRWLVAAGAAVGLGVLAKGPVAGAIFMLGAIPFAVLRQRPKPDPLLRPSWLGLAALAALLLAAPWYALMLARHRQHFFDFFFVQMNVDRFRTPWQLASLGVLWGGLVAWLLPWLPLAVAAVVDALARSRRRDARYLLALSWAAAVMVTFSIPAQKFPHYGLPAVPALALLVALLWTERGESRALRVGAALTAVGCGLAAVGGVVGARVLPPALAVPTAIAAALACAAFWRRRLVTAAGLSLATVALALGWLTPAAGFPPWPDGPVPDRPTYVYREAPGLVEFASGRDVRYLRTPEERDAALASGGLVWMAEQDNPGPPAEVIASQRSMRVDATPDDVLTAFREGSLAPLVGRMVLVGRPAL